ncbi:hypothetical protein AVT97_gp06 [Sulfolobales Virus YNP2]|uniref:hypothetical protein n=1 Tax=Sulfolobales Virus YNP2 TaxID=1732180 RepID=UPI000705EC32|nr:hypothetical protein AVT97_gp06 [Sulfolobales Virus YNP2]ALG97169.1 hypothetical protein [Sulfolobales Virus YNP2]
MEATLTNVIIAVGGGAAVATTATLLLTRKKKKPVYTVSNVVWWIDKHISPKMLSSPKPKVVDKIYGQYAYLTLPIQDISLNIDKLMKRTKTSRLDDDFLYRLTWAFVAKQFIGKPFLFFGILRNKYLPLKRVERKTILPESDSTLLETSNIDLDVNISKPLLIPPMYFFVKVTDNLSYFLLLINRNAVRLFEPTISAAQT